VESNLALQSFADGEWRPPIVKTEATTGRGVAELWQTIQAFRTHSEGQRDRRVRSRNAFRLRELLTQRFLDHIERDVLAPGEFDRVVERIASRELDPYSAAAEILRKALRAATAAGGAPPHAGDGPR
jgi:LAO/AO transport system kinase